MAVKLKLKISLIAKLKLKGRMVVKLNLKGSIVATQGILPGPDTRRMVAKRKRKGNIVPNTKLLVQICCLY